MLSRLASISLSLDRLFIYEWFVSMMTRAKANIVTPISMVRVSAAAL